MDNIIYSIKSYTDKVKKTAFKTIFYYDLVTKGIEKTEFE